MSKDWNFALRLAQKTDFLMACQERTGVQFDIEGAKKLWEYCNTEMQKIEETVEPQLPEKDLNKGELAACTPPKNQFKNATTKAEKEEADDYGRIPSANAHKWFDEITTEPSGQGQFIWVGWKEGMKFQLPHYEPIRTKGPMRLGNQQQLKDWLVSCGWRPTFFNLKKGKDGKPERDSSGKVIHTSPKFHQMGELCPNLIKLGDSVELIKPVVRWLSLRNRRSVIWNPERETGWLEHPRLKKDGRLPAGASGITNTMRQKHRTVVNVPRKGSVLGEEMRSLFIAREGMTLVGYDASALEARVEAHCCYKYTGGKAYAMELLDGDVHTKNAQAFFGQDIPLDKEGKAEGEYRNPSKNGRYALTYGCTVPRLADTLGIPLERAKVAYNDFWDTNTALKEFRDALTRHWEGSGKSKVKCHWTGYTLHSRSKHSLVNLIFQHLGAIVMDLSTCLMDKWLGGIQYDEDNLPCYIYKGYKIRRVLFVHDELQWECSSEIADELGEMGCKSIEKSGEILGFNVPLAGDYDEGSNWGLTH